MVTSNNTITQLMTGMLFLFSEGKPQSIKIDTPFVKSFRLKRGNLIPNQSYDNEKIIFEIAKKNDHAGASFKGFIYKDSKFSGKLIWNDGRKFHFDGTCEVRKPDLFRLRGHSIFNKMVKQEFVLILIHPDTGIKSINIWTGFY